MAQNPLNTYTGTNPYANPNIPKITTPAQFDQRKGELGIPPAQHVPTNEPAPAGRFSEALPAPSAPSAPAMRRADHGDSVFSGIADYADVFPMEAVPEPPPYEGPPAKRGARVDRLPPQQPQQSAMSAPAAMATRGALLPGRLAGALTAMAPPPRR